MTKKLKINKMKNLNYKKIKKIFVCTICFALLCSCNNSQKQEEIAKEKAKQQAFADSLAEITRLKELARQDSIIRVKDSLAIYAWGDAKFGISVKEALKTDALKGCDVYRFAKGNPQTYMSKYYDWDALFRHLDVRFHYDRLCRLSLETDTYELSNDYEISKKYDKIEEMITSKYGKPSSVVAYEYLLSNFKEKKWFIGDKTIALEVRLKDKRTCIIECNIYSNKEVAVENEYYSKMREIEKKEEQEYNENNYLF